MVRNRQPKGERQETASEARGRRDVEGTDQASRAQDDSVPDAGPKQRGPLRRATKLRKHQDHLNTPPLKEEPDEGDNKRKRREGTEPARRRAPSKDIRARGGRKRIPREERETNAGRRTQGMRRKSRETEGERAKDGQERSAGKSIEPRRPRTREGASAGLTPVDTHSKGSKRRESTQKRNSPCNTSDNPSDRPEAGPGTDPHYPQRADERERKGSPAPRELR